MINEKAKEFLKFQAEKDIKYLYKRFLELLGDLRNQHVMMLQKLDNELPSEYDALVRASNYLDDNEYAFFRKKILDAGNDTIRNLSEQIDKFEIALQVNQD